MHESGHDIYWMGLTFVSLDPASQVDCLEHRVPRRADPKACLATANPLIALQNVLVGYEEFWMDAHHPRIQAWKRFDERVRRLLAGPESPGPYCLEELQHGPVWQELRVLARDVLAEGGIGPYPIRRGVDFGRYVELADPET